MTSQWGFNSKLVRLKADENMVTHWSYLFQFQTGAIKSLDSTTYQWVNALFQFQTGAIKSRLLLE